MDHIIKNHLLKHEKKKLYNLGVCFKKEKKVTMKQMLNVVIWNLHVFILFDIFNVNKMKEEKTNKQMKLISRRPK